MFREFRLPIMIRSDTIYRWDRQLDEKSTRLQVILITETETGNFQQKEPLEKGGGDKKYNNSSTSKIFLHLTKEIIKQLFMASFSIMCNTFYIKQHESNNESPQWATERD
jgi:hypothetical protein